MESQAVHARTPPQANTTSANCSFGLALSGCGDPALVNAMSPERLQRQRTKGWRIPEGAVYVGRPTRWGNPFKVGDPVHVGPMWAGRDTIITDAETAVEFYRRWLFNQRTPADLVPILRGRDLACWCPLDQPCHADVLLEMANQEVE
jgi:hypothetical protein